MKLILSSSDSQEVQITINEMDKYMTIISNILIPIITTFLSCLINLLEVSYSSKTGFDGYTFFK